MQKKLSSKAKLIILISTIHFVYASGTKSISSKLTESRALARQQFQLSTAAAFPATSESPLAYSLPTFRDTLLTKSKLVLNDGTTEPNPIDSYSISSNYGGSIYKIKSSAKPVEEALPEVSSERSGESSENSSGEDFNSILGVETTSVSPLFLETPSSTSRPVTAKQVAQITAQRHPFHPTQEKEVEILNAQRIKAAVKTKHTFEFRPVVLDQIQEQIQPKIIEVAAKSVPLEIHFKSASSRIKLVQSHQSEDLQEEQHTSSDEEPQRLVHLVRKPIIQEVREIITPYRRIVQEIAPVMEEIHTIVSHEDEKSGKQLSKTNNQSKTNTNTLKQTTSTTSTSNNLATNKVEQKPKPQVPSNWLRPVPKNPPKPIEQVRMETGGFKPIHHTSSSSSLGGSSSKNNYAPTYNTYPLEPTPPDQEHEFSSEHETSEVEDLNNRSIEIVSGNDISTIIPARLMQEIIHDYQTRNRMVSNNGKKIETNRFVANNNRNNQNNNNHHSNERLQQRPQTQQQHYHQNSRPLAPQRPRPQPQQQHQQQHQQQQQQSSKNVQQLRESASSHSWQAIRPYVYYGAQNGQYRGPFPYKQNINGYNRY